LTTKNEKSKEKVNKKFLEYIQNNRNGDCAEDVFKKARTPWQKQVAVELFVNERDHKLMEKDMKHVKRMVWAIFTVVIITAMANFVTTYILPLISGV